MKKIISASFIVIVVAVFPTYGQLNKINQTREAFVERGVILTGLSFSLIHGSQQEFSLDYTNEVKRASLNLKGIYFLTNHIGFGPTISYVFSYGDLNTVTPDKEDTEIRNPFWVIGTNIAYYISLNELFGNHSNTYLFINGGIVLRHVKTELKDFQKISPLNEIGYRLGVGLLVPTVNQLSFFAKVDLRAHRHKNNVGKKSITKIKWPKAFSLSVGLNFAF